MELQSENRRLSCDISRTLILLCFGVAIRTTDMFFFSLAVSCR